MPRQMRDTRRPVEPRLTYSMNTPRERSVVRSRPSERMLWRSGGSVINAQRPPPAGHAPRGAGVAIQGAAADLLGDSSMQTRTIGSVTVSAIGLGGMPMSVEG